MEFTRKQISLWEKVILKLKRLILKEPSHLHQVSGQVFLPRQLVHTGMVVDSLMGLHFLYSVGKGCGVLPKYIPVEVWFFNVTKDFSRYFILESTANIRKQFILGR